MTRQHTLQQLASRIITLHHDHPLRVAIDGIDAAGKTTLAYEQRYIPAQQLYLQRDHPQERADAIVDNNDPSSPALLVAHL